MSETYKRQANVVNPKNRVGAATLLAQAGEVALDFYQKNKQNKAIEQDFKFKQQQAELQSQEKLMKESMDAVERGEVIDQEYLNSALTNDQLTQFHAEREGYKYGKSLVNQTLSKVATGEIILEGGMSALDLVHQQIKEQGLQGQSLSGINRYLGKNAEKLRNASIENLDKQSEELYSSAILTDHMDLLSEYKEAGADLTQWGKDVYSGVQKAIDSGRFSDDFAKKYFANVRGHLAREVKAGNMSVKDYNSVSDALQYREITLGDGSKKDILGASNSPEWIMERQSINTKQGAIEKERLRQSHNKVFNFKDTSNTLNSYNFENLSQEEQSRLIRDNEQKNDYLSKIYNEDGTINIEAVEEDSQLFQTASELGLLEKKGIDVDRESNPIIQGKRKEIDAMLFSTLLSGDSLTYLISSTIDENGNIDQDKLFKHDTFKNIKKAATSDIQITDKYKSNLKAYTSEEFSNQVDLLAQTLHNDGSNLTSDQRKDIKNSLIELTGYDKNVALNLSNMIDGKVFTPEERRDNLRNYLHTKGEINNILGIHNDNSVNDYVSSLNFSKQSDINVLSSLIDLFDNSVELNSAGITDLSLSRMISPANLKKLKSLSIIKKDTLKGLIRENPQDEITPEMVDNALHNRLIENEKNAFVENYSMANKSINVNALSNIMPDGRIIDVSGTNSSKSGGISKPNPFGISNNASAIMSSGWDPDATFNPLADQAEITGVNSQESIQNSLISSGIDFVRYGEDGQIHLGNRSSILNEILKGVGLSDGYFFGDKVDTNTPTGLYIADNIGRIGLSVQNHFSHQSRITQEQYDRKLQMAIESDGFLDDIVIFGDGDAMVFPIHQKENISKSEIELMKSGLKEFRKIGVEISKDIHKNSTDYSKGVVDLKTKNGGYYRKTILGNIRQEVNPFTMDFDPNLTTDSSPQGSVIVNWDTDYMLGFNNSIGLERYENLTVGDKRMANELMKNGLARIAENGKVILNQSVPFNSMIKSLDNKSEKEREMRKLKMRYLSERY